MFKNELPGQGKKVGLVGIPLGYGAGKPGSDLGVQAMRMSVVRNGTLASHIRDLGYDVVDHGDVDVVTPAITNSPDGNPKFADEMAATFRNVSTHLRSSLSAGEIPVI